MNPKRFEGNTINVFEILEALFHHVVAIILVTVLFGTAGYCGSRFLLTPVYSAEAMMIVNSGERDSDYVSLDQLESATTLIDTYSIVIKSKTVMNSVRDNLGIDKDTYKSKIQDVTVSSVNGTQVMKIKVSGTDPELALAICQEITKVSPGVLLDVVEAGSVKIVEQAAINYGEVSPNNLTNAIKAAIVGFVLTAMIIIVGVLIDNKIKGENDIKSLDLPLLGVIPSYDQGGR